MKTILEPAKPYFKLLGKQKHREGASYRLMNFVVQAAVDDGLLLLHNMTKEMVLLSKEEQQVFEQCPTDLPELMNHWFLVPEDYDDCKLSQQLSNVARMLEPRKTNIIGYTIMTTSDCNARCFYCYELGQARRPMTEETAQKVADYIIKHCGEEDVNIEWFGGEPLFNKPVITLICNRLKEANVKYISSMISNGFLMDAETVKEAHDLWNMNNIQITIDGTEATYNRVKAYIYKGVNAYERVMENIGHLIAADINVSIRMNMDMYNADELERLAVELHERFKGNKNLRAYAHLLFEDKNKHAGVCDEDKRRALMQKMRHLQDKLTDFELYTSHEFSSNIRTNNCMSDNDASVVIQPDGYITKCEHYTDSHHVGHVNEEDFDEQMITYFKEKGTSLMEACFHCVKYPSCTFLKACPHGNECYPEMPEVFAYNLQQEIKQIYASYLKQEQEVDEKKAKEAMEGKELPAETTEAEKGWEHEKQC